MARVEVTLSDWIITVDGIQVPYLSWSVQTGVDNPGMAQIALEPDAILPNIPPKSMVHIWMYDEGPNESFSGDDRIKEGYKLYWEGEYRSYQYSKTPYKSFTIVAQGCIAILEGHKMFMSGTGTPTVSPLITGSTLLKLPSSTKDSFLPLVSLMMKTFGKDVNPGKSPIGDVPFRYRQSDPYYADRLNRLIVMLCSYNASLRLQVVRTRLLNKIATLHDESMKTLVPLVMAQAYARQMANGVGQNSSVLEMMNITNAYFFHHYVSTTAPITPAGPAGGHDFIGSLTSNASDIPTDGRSIVRTYYRNDYLIVPETFYAIPPACNLIFPEFVRQMNVGRDFLQEPTRAVLTDNTFGNALSVIMPDDIFRFDNDAENPTSPSEMWAASRLGPNMPPSAYTSPIGGGKVNLLAAVTDDEITKGIIPYNVNRPMHLMSAMARQFPNLVNKGQEGASDGDTKTPSEQVKAHLKTLINQASALNSGFTEGLNEVDGSGKSVSQYVYILKALADYNFQTARFSRQLSVSMEGHRWLVPGFTGIILGKDISWGCWIRSHTFSVDENGAEASSIEIDQVRPLPRLAPEQQSNITQELEKRGAEVKVASNALVNEYIDVIFTMEGQYEILLGDGGEEAWPDFKELFDQVASDLISTPVGKVYLQETDQEVFFYSTSASLKRHDTFSLSDNKDLYGRMKKVVIDYARYQAGVAAEIADRGQNALDKTSSIGRKVISTAKKVVSESFVRLGSALPKPPHSYPYPSLFANMDLLSVDKSTEIYSGLLGASPIFSTIAKGASLTESASLTSSDTQLVARTSFMKYAHFLNVLGRIFPIYPELAGGTEWDSHTDGAAVDSRGAKSWETDTFLRRKGLMTLGKFLDTNGLKLEYAWSSPPTPTRFIKLVPKKVTQVKSDKLNEKLTWDNSIFSKIIDEWEDFNRPIIQPEHITGTRDTKLETSDPAIKTVRESVEDPLLTTKARQDQLIVYAQRHFGSRGYDGR